MRIDRFPIWMAFAGAALTALAGCKGQDTELVIKPDGSCEVRQKMLVQRAMLEQQIQYMEMMKGADDFDEEDAEEGAEEEKQALSDAELEKRLREMVEDEEMSFAGGAEVKVEEIAFKGDDVALATTTSYGTLKELARPPFVFEQTGFDRIVADEDQDGNFKLTFHVSSFVKRDLKSMSKQIKMTGFKGSFKIVLPGKVLESSLPHSEGSATWITIDAEKPETLNALEKIYESGSVEITSEMGGLDLELPLDSKKLARSGMFDEAEPDLPLTDAAPGFTAEADSVTTTSAYYFPGAPEEFKETNREADRAGVVVSAKLYPPRGRSLLSVGDTRAVSAVDDQGREIEPADEGDRVFGRSMSYSGDEDRERAASIELRLAEPEPDAEAIEELAGEAVAVTFGRWKEHRVADVRADPENVIDLTDVLPGAEMIVGKIKGDKQEEQGDFTSREGQILLKIRGPDEIRQLRFKVEIEGVENVSSHNRRDSTKEKEGTKVRSVSVGYNVFIHDEGPATGPLTLIVRYPDDMRRERVKFSLEGLDLF